MNLLEVIRDLDRFDPDHTIYAKEPWTPDSLAIVALQPDEGDPADVTRLGVKYFLEIFIANECLEGWQKGNGRLPTLEEKYDLISYYAMYDAFK